MIENLLGEFGFNDSEKKVFVCLLERGPSIASVLAKGTGLKRPTVYAALESLQDLGVVLRQKKGSVTYFSLVRRATIEAILTNRAQRKFENVKDAARILGGQLERFEVSEGVELAGFSVAAIESVEGVYGELEASLLGGDFCGIFNPQLAIANKQTEKIVAGFLEKTGVSKPRIREIAVKGPKTDWYKSKIVNPNHEVREISAEKKILSDMIFLDGAVFVAHYEPSREVAIKVTQPDFYQSMMTVFEMLWDQGS